MLGLSPLGLIVVGIILWFVFVGVLHAIGAAFIVIGCVLLLFWGMPHYRRGRGPVA